MFVDGDPEKGVFLFAHGAGAPADSEFMSLMADALAARGVQVVRFEFSYMAQRRHGGSKRPPDRINKLEIELLELVERFDHDLPVFIGGKSMGGVLLSECSKRAELKPVLSLATLYTQREILKTCVLKG